MQCHVKLHILVVNCNPVCLQSVKIHIHSITVDLVCVCVCRQVRWKRGHPLKKQSVTVNIQVYIRYPA
jgi:hypothetical protein